MNDHHASRRLEVLQREAPHLIAAPPVSFREAARQVLAKGHDCELDMLAARHLSQLLLDAAEAIDDVCKASTRQRRRHARALAQRLRWKARDLTGSSQ
jgi:hypothetical protein